MNEMDGKSSRGYGAKETLPEEVMGKQANAEGGIL